MSSHDLSSRSQRGYVPTTAIIWGCSTGMLALDLLLSKTAQSGTMIAIAVVSAAAVSTIAVWLAPGKAVLTKTETPGQS